MQSHDALPWVINPKDNSLENQEYGRPIYEDRTDYGKDLEHPTTICNWSSEMAAVFQKVSPEESYIRGYEFAQISGLDGLHEMLPGSVLKRLFPEVHLQLFWDGATAYILKNDYLYNILKGGDK
jgi:hypothetical protein